jgi:hypothetical protein
MASADSRLRGAYSSAIAKGKALDVSKLLADGTGARSTKIPTTTKGTKRWVGELPVLSNNYASYALAMSLLGADFVPFANVFLQQYGANPIARSPKAVVVRAGVTSPGRFKTIQPVVPHVLGTAVVMPTVRVRTPPRVVMPPPVMMPYTTITRFSPPRVTMAPVPRPLSPTRQVPMVPVTRVSPIRVSPTRTVPIIPVPVTRTSPRTLSPGRLAPLPTFTQVGGGLPVIPGFQG